MAFTKVSPAHKDAVRAVDKTIHEKDGVYSACAHHPDDPDMGRILKTGHPCCIGRRIAAPVAEKTEYPWFRFLICHSTHFVCCHLSFVICLFHIFSYSALRNQLVPQPETCN